MNLYKLSAAVMAAGLLVAAPAFAQTAQKQPTQSDGPSMPAPTGGNFNADPNYKQKTQEGGGPSMPGPAGGNFNADPNYNPYKQKTQNLTPSSTQGAYQATGNGK